MKKKFKIGDKVKIVNPNVDSYGAIGVIVDIDKDWEFPYEVEFEDEKYEDVLFIDDELELVEKFEKKEEDDEDNDSYVYIELKNLNKINQEERDKFMQNTLKYLQESIDKNVKKQNNKSVGSDLENEKNKKGLPTHDDLLDMVNDSIKMVKYIYNKEDRAYEYLMVMTKLIEAKGWLEEYSRNRLGRE